MTPSAVNLFKDCPACFWRATNKKEKRPTGPFSTLPIQIDHLLKKYFDKYREENSLPPELAHLTDTKLFPGKNKIKEWRDNFKGLTSYDKENNLLRGAVDEILVKDNKLIVLDFKTRGFAPKEETNELYRTQLELYTILLQKQGYVTEDYAYLLYLIPQNITETGKIEFYTILEKVKLDLEYAKKVYTKAVEMLEYDEPPLNPKCKFCNYKHETTDKPEIEI